MQPQPQPGARPLPLPLPLPLPRPLPASTAVSASLNVPQLRKSVVTRQRPFAAAATQPRCCHNLKLPQLLTHICCTRCSLPLAKVVQVLVTSYSRVLALSQQRFAALCTVERTEYNNKSNSNEIFRNLSILLKRGIISIIPTKDIPNRNTSIWKI